MPPNGTFGGELHTSDLRYLQVPGPAYRTQQWQYTSIMQQRQYLPVQPAISRDAGMVWQAQGKGSSPRIHKHVQPCASWQPAQSLLQLLSPDGAGL